MGRASMIIASHFKQVMEDDTSALGGLINKEESQIYTLNIKYKTNALIANILHYPLVGKWSFFNYLGIPISVGVTPTSSSLPLMNKINTKFSSWGS
jgi:hypothetical protein